MSLQQVLMASPMLQAAAMLATAAFIVHIGQQTVRVVARTLPQASPRTVTAVASVTAVTVGPFTLVLFDVTMAAGTRAAAAVVGRPEVAAVTTVRPDFLVGVATPAVVLVVAVAAIGAWTGRPSPRRPDDVARVR